MNHPTTVKKKGTMNIPTDQSKSASYTAPDWRKASPLPKQEGYKHGAWKDDELDYIWHHAMKLVRDGKMDVYEALNIIESQMAIAIHDAHQQGYAEGKRKMIEEVLGKVERMKEMESILIGDAYTDEIYEKDCLYNRALSEVLNTLKDILDTLTKEKV
jgi:hypothetical protein